MNKKGFTLMELLVVIAIIGVVGLVSVISFTSIKDDTAEDELKNKYIDIQRGASMYLDLNPSDQEWFIEKGKIDIKLSQLKNENYISKDLSNPVNGDDISESYYVRIIICNKEESNEYVDSCIINKSKSKITNIANRKGEFNHGCCE